ncbi:MAG: Na+/H+ antiporter subunit E [Vicinamibacterales bacterium]|nr:Na+/H+ antiporter subunit E [Vicinamibacterales bacterium]
MTGIPIALLLAAIWVALTGQFSLVNLGLGVLLGLGAVRFAVPARRGEKRLRLSWALVRFPIVVIWALLLSNLRVARTVLFTPVDRLTPGIMAVPLRLTTDAEITALANLITLTPGTLTLDVSTDRRVLFVHVLDLSDPDAALASIRAFEQGVREIYR